jgi:hypothetical protein
VGKLSDIYYLEDLGVDGGVVLKWVSKRYDMGVDCTFLDRKMNMADASRTRSTSFSNLTS